VFGHGLWKAGWAPSSRTPGHITVPVVSLPQIAGFESLLQDSGGLKIVLGEAGSVPYRLAPELTPRMLRGGGGPTHRDT
jgi:hypothetical protein